MTNNPTIMFKKFKNILFNRRLRRAMREANELSALTGLRYFVIILDGEVKVVSKRRLKQLIDTRRFRKRTTIRDFEKLALHITN